jgi:hypothetical protein
VERDSQRPGEKIQKKSHQKDRTVWKEKILIGEKEAMKT